MDKKYKVVNLETDESHGEYETLAEARGAVAYDRLKAYEIWSDVGRVISCDPYYGNDDRVKQALGMPNASEAA